MLTAKVPSPHGPAFHVDLPHPDNIVPAVKKASEEVDGETNSSNSEFVAKTVENNVKLTMDRIREKSPILAEMEKNGEIQIVGGVYSLQNGEVTML